MAGTGLVGKGLDGPRGGVKEGPLPLGLCQGSVVQADQGHYLVPGAIQRKPNLMM